MQRQRVYPQRFVSGRWPVDLRLGFEMLDGQRVDPSAEPLIAGTRGTWMLEFVNEGPDLGAGCALCVVRFNYQFAFQLQTHRPGGRDFCTVESPGAARFTLGVGRSSVDLLTLAVAGGVWRQGETVRVRLGDRRHGGAGSEIFWSATEARLLVGVDADGGGRFQGVRGNPWDFRVAAEPQPWRVRALVPSVAAPEEPFTVHVGVFDRHGNPVEEFTGTVALEVPSHVTGLPERYTFKRADRGNHMFTGVQARAPGVYRLRVSLSADSARPGAQAPEAFLSNPLKVCAEPSLRVFWGDVHAHGWGDSTMYLMHLRSAKLDPLERHVQARDLGRLDFSCPGAMSMDPEQRESTWRVYRQAFHQTDAPGAYVPFLSYEAHPPEGDRQVIFRQDEELPPPPMRLPMAPLDAALGGRDDVLLQVHTGGAPPVWEAYRPARERLVEVCSGFGCAEWLLQRALRLGYRPAVCAASDLHLGFLGGLRAVEPFRGRFGQKYPMRQRDAAYGTGPLTAVPAGELSRDALWKSITGGTSYATSGARMILELAIDGGVDRSRVSRHQLARGVHLSLAVHACAPLHRVALICGKYRLRAWHPCGLDWFQELELDADQLPGNWLYVRVEQDDGEYAWSRVVYLEERDPLPLAGSLPAWNQEDSDAEHIPQPNEATAHLPDVEGYLKREEDLERFRNLIPVRVELRAVGRCALFFCRWGEERLPLSIRWFFEFQIPRIRFDFGWRDYGMMDEMDLGSELMERYA